MSARMVFLTGFWVKNISSMVTLTKATLSLKGKSWVEVEVNCQFSLRILVFSALEM